MSHSLTLEVLAGGFTIYRLPSDAPIPATGNDSGFMSITRTEDELSLVMRSDHKVSEWMVSAKTDQGWSCLKVRGPLDFSLTGILASLASPLAEAGIPIFAISTFDTDYLLLKTDALSEATQVLRSKGHQVITVAGQA